MAIDFPSSPTNGQVYGNWIYDSSITAWRNVNTDAGIGTLNAMGLKNVVPTSVVVGSGSATTNSNGKVTFSGASTISLNGVFTSTYENYRVVLNLTAAAPADITLRGRVSGTDWTGSNYMYAKSNSNSTAWSIQTYTAASNLVNLGRVNGSGYHTSSNFDINYPQTTNTTQINGQWVDGAFYGNCWASILTAAQYDGFTIFGATLSGTMQVYGYNS